MTKPTQPVKNESKSTSTKPVFKSLKKANCPTLSGSGIIDYEISINSAGELFIGLTGNSGSGHFGKELISLNDAVDLLMTHAEKHPISALTVQKLYPSNSSLNSGGFMAAVLLSLGLLERAENKRQLKLCDNPADIIASLKEVKPKHKPPSKRKPKAKA
jgi:hypothetical protein